MTDCALGRLAGGGLVAVGGGGGAGGRGSGRTEALSIERPIFRGPAPVRGDNMSLGTQVQISELNGSCNLGHHSQSTEIRTFRSPSRRGIKSLNGSISYLQY
jgi:hypothetical protein